MLMAQILMARNKFFGPKRTRTAVMSQRRGMGANPVPAKPCFDSHARISVMPTTPVRSHGQKEKKVEYLAYVVLAMHTVAAEHLMRPFSAPRIELWSGGPPHSHNSSVSTACSAHVSVDLP